MSLNNSAPIPKLPLICIPKFRSRKLPVVIGIHGGGFEIGSAAWIPGGAILDVVRDVIFVSIQYRLGIWGLLTTGDDISPGNLLYWDQHYAIRWVRDNIEYFGGNPEEVFSCYDMINNYSFNNIK